MPDFLVHFGVVNLNIDEIKNGHTWKLVAECGIIVKEQNGPRTGDITLNLAEVTCPECQEANALRALVEFT